MAVGLEVVNKEEAKPIRMRRVVIFTRIYWLFVGDLARRFGVSEFWIYPYRLLKVVFEV